MSTWVVVAFLMVVIAITGSSPSESRSLSVSVSSSTHTASSSSSPSLTQTSRTKSQTKVVPVPIPTIPPTTAAPTAPPINVSKYFPVGTVSAAGLTGAPTSAGPIPNTSRTIRLPSNGKERAFRNQVHFRFTSFNEQRVFEYLRLVAFVTSAFLLEDSQLNGEAARNLSSSLVRRLEDLRNASGASLLDRYSVAGIQNRLVPLLTLQAFVAPSARSSRQSTLPSSLEYGKFLLVPLIILRVNATTGRPLRKTGTAPYPSLSVPVRLNSSVALTTATNETDTLCEAVQAAFEVLLSKGLSPLSTASNPDDWLKATLVDARCVAMAPTLIVADNVGVNVLWIVFIIMGCICVAISIIVMIVRSRGDTHATMAVATTNDPKRKAEEAAERQQREELEGAPAEQATALPNLDTRTDTGSVLEEERVALISKRRRTRLEELVAKALTGDSTIYGASEEEREMVAAVLNNPKFDGGTTSREGDTEASPVNVILQHDRLFTLPPTHGVTSDQFFSGGLFSRLKRRLEAERAAGNVTSVSFAAGLSANGASMGVGGGAVSATDLTQGTTIDSRMQAALDEQADASAKDEAATQQVPSLVAVSSVAAPQSIPDIDPDDEVMKINRMMTEAALRHVKRREALVVSAPSAKGRLLKILEDDDDLDM